jgi:hypothetical protein
VRAAEQTPHMKDMCGFLFILLLAKQTYGQDASEECAAEMVHNIAQAASSQMQTLSKVLRYEPSALQHEGISLAFTQTDSQMEVESNRSQLSDQAGLQRFQMTEDLDPFIGDIEGGFVSLNVSWIDSEPELLAVQTSPPRHAPKTSKICRSRLRATYNQMAKLMQDVSSLTFEAKTLTVEVQVMRKELRAKLEIMKREETITTKSARKCSRGRRVSKKIVKVLKKDLSVVKQLSVKHVVGWAKVKRTVKRTVKKVRRNAKKSSKRKSREARKCPSAKPRCLPVSCVNGKWRCGSSNDPRKPTVQPVLKVHKRHGRAKKRKVVKVKRVVKHHVKKVTRNQRKALLLELRLGNRNASRDLWQAGTLVELAENASTQAARCLLDTRRDQHKQARLVAGNSDAKFSHSNTSLVATNTSKSDKVKARKGKGRKIMPVVKKSANSKSVTTHHVKTGYKVTTKTVWKMVKVVKMIKVAVSHVEKRLVREERKLTLAKSKGKKKQLTKRIKRDKKKRKRARKQLKRNKRLLKKVKTTKVSTVTKIKIKKTYAKLELRRNKRKLMRDKRKLKRAKSKGKGKKLVKVLKRDKKKVKQARRLLRRSTKQLRKTTIVRVSTVKKMKTKVTHVTAKLMRNKRRLMRDKRKLQRAKSKGEKKRLTKRIKRDKKKVKRTRKQLKRSKKLFNKAKRTLGKRIVSRASSVSKLRMRSNCATEVTNLRRVYVKSVSQLSTLVSTYQHEWKSCKRAAVVHKQNNLVVQQRADELSTQVGRRMDQLAQLRPALESAKQAYRTLKRQTTNLKRQCKALPKTIKTLRKTRHQLRSLSKCPGLRRTR